MVGIVTKQQEPEIIKLESIADLEKCCTDLTFPINAHEYLAMNLKGFGSNVLLIH